MIPIIMTRQEKTDFLNTYLKNNGYNFDKFDQINNADLNEIYDLFKNNIIPDNKKVSPGWYGIYHDINSNKNDINSSKNDSIMEYFTLGIELNDSGSKHNFYYKITKNYELYDQKLMDRALAALNKFDDKINYKKFSELRPIVLAIDQYVKNNEMDKIYNLYNDLKDDSEKKQYLSKVMVLPKFKPTKDMISDLVKLDFTNDSLDIQLVKSIFAGLNLGI